MFLRDVTSSRPPPPLGTTRSALWLSCTAALPDGDAAGVRDGWEQRVLARATPGVRQALLAVGGWPSRRAASGSAGDKYRWPHVVDGMRQAALGRWMEYLCTNAELKEAFGFAPADASEPYYGSLISLVLDSLSAHRVRHARILDIGAGVGRVAYELAQHEDVATVIALDRSPELVDEICSLAEGTARAVWVPTLGDGALPAILRPPAPAPKLAAIQGDALNLPFEDNAFDCVVSSGTLDRVDVPQRLADEMERVLVPGGIAIVSCLHDWANSPASGRGAVSSTAELFSTPAWHCEASRDLALVLRQNSRFVEQFSADVVVARREIESASRRAV